MPNLDPVPDSRIHLDEELAVIRRDAAIDVRPYGACTVGEKGETLSDMDAMAADVCAFSDDGKGIQSEDMMRRAMIKARSHHKVLAAHCEDNALVRGGRHLQADRRGPPDRRSVHRHDHVDPRKRQDPA